MNETIEQLAIARDERQKLLRRAQNVAEKARDAADEAAQKVVHAEIARIYGPTLRHLMDEYSAANEALTAAKTEAALAGEGAPVPLGTVLYEWERPYRRWDRTAQPYAKTGKTAVLEAVTPESRFASNISYGLPQVGEFILRLRRADGKVGIQYKPVNHIGHSFFLEGADPNNKSFCSVAHLISVG